MRSILIDELLAPEVTAVRDYLDDQAEPSGLEDLYWINLEPELWNEAQWAAHNSDQEGVEGRSFRFAVEVGSDWVRFEMLVRSEGLRNLGGGMADDKQTRFLLAWIDEMQNKLGLFASTAPDQPAQGGTA